jgi:hypothetical protein
MSSSELPPGLLSPPPVLPPGLLLTPPEFPPWGAEEFIYLSNLFWYSLFNSVSPGIGSSISFQ